MLVRTILNDLALPNCRIVFMIFIDATVSSSTVATILFSCAWMTVAIATSDSITHIFNFLNLIN